VIDDAAFDLVVADEAGQDRQAGGVGAGPAGMTVAAGPEVENGPGVRGPAVRRSVGVEQLVELARALLDDEDEWALCVPAGGDLRDRRGADRVPKRICVRSPESACR
jgi:hypothetical protein